MRTRSISSAGQAWSLPVVVIAGGAVAGLGLLSIVVSPVLLLAAPATLVLLLIAIRSPRATALGTLMILPAVGLLRRASGSYLAPIDPLTLLGPIVAMTCLVVFSRTRAPLRRTPLGAVVAGVLVLGVAQIVNPAQGGIGIGIVGAGLFVGPLLWFFVGRHIGNVATLSLVLRVLRVAAVAAAIYGTKQLTLGFTGFEDRWVMNRLSSYVALGISGSIRPFSSFASGAEYSQFLALGAIAFMVWRGSVARIFRLSVVFALLITSFYAGSRSIFVTGVLAVVLLALAHRVRSLGRALALCLAVGVGGLALLQLVPLTAEDSTAAKIRNRTVEGLTNPFDRDSSTLGIHIDAFSRGVLEGLRTPLGHGAASVNLAGFKLRGTSVSAEHDVPNMLLAYGWIGGVLLLVLVLRVYRLVRVCVQRGRKELLGPAIFVLAVFGYWFSGELYAVSSLVWFFLGSLDGVLADSPPASSPPVTVASETPDGEPTRRSIPQPSR